VAKPRRSRRHWFDGLVQVMKDDKEEMMGTLIDTFRDTYSLRPKGQQPSMTKKEELAFFMGMSQPERLRMANELGPDGWNAKVEEMMGSLVNEIGPAANRMLPWLTGGVPEQVEPTDRGQLEQELLEMLGGGPEIG